MGFFGSQKQMSSLESVLHKDYSLLYLQPLWSLTSDPGRIRESLPGCFETSGAGGLLGSRFSDPGGGWECKPIISCNLGFSISSAASNSMNLGHKESQTELREKRFLTQEIADNMVEPQL
jgi:hypothetical protein